MSASTSMRSPGAKEKPQKCICLLCKRKFPSAEALRKHEMLSELHMKNVMQQEQQLSLKKAELRQRTVEAKKQLVELENAMNEAVLPNESMLQRKDVVEREIREMENEYGLAQDKIESRRHEKQTRSLTGTGDLRKKATLSEKELGVGGGFLFLAGACSWQGNKDVQEDRYVLDLELQGPLGEKLIGFCVFDGHSGGICADYLVENLHRNVQSVLKTKKALTEESLKQAVVEGFVLTDDDFLKRARSHSLLDGSTGIMCLLWAGENQKTCSLLVANVGDSRAVLCKQDPKTKRPTAVRLSDDHKPGRADERRRIEARGGMVMDLNGIWRVFSPAPLNFAGRSIQWGLAVSRAFGDCPLKEPQLYGCPQCDGNLVSALPEISTFELHPTEDWFVVVACDGVWDVVADEEACGLALGTAREKPDLAAKMIVRKSFEIGSDDNLSAVVFRWRVADGGERERSPGSKRRRSS